MRPQEALRTVLALLEEAGIAYMMTGGLVRNLYAIPRATNDADIVIQMEVASFQRFIQQLPKAIELDPQVSFEAITGSQRYILKLARSSFRIELFILGNDPHHRERFSRRRQQPMAELGCAVWVARAEDLIIQKLRWYRDKDRDDLSSIIAVQAESLDWPYLESWAERHGTEKRLREIRSAIPPLPPTE